MANFTKGKWEVTKHPPLDNWVIDINPNDLLNKINIAHCYGSEADANLMAVAVNACAKVNPDNPQAVAESIGDMYEACQLARNLANLIIADAEEGSPARGTDEAELQEECLESCKAKAKKILLKTEEALAKAEGKL